MKIQINHINFELSLNVSGTVLQFSNFRKIWERVFELRPLPLCYTHTYIQHVKISNQLKVFYILKKILKVAGLNLKIQNFLQ